jgi:hypothetical protein
LLGPGWGEGQPLELDGTQVRVASEVGRHAAGLLELAAAACADGRRSLAARLLGAGSQRGGNGDLAAGCGSPVG